MPRQAALRKPPSLFGVGLLEAVEDAQGPDPDQQPDTRRKGRFGWKAQFRTLDDAVAAAFANELGLLSPQFMKGRAELTTEQVSSVSQFLRTLPAPSVRDVRQTQEGRRVFDRLGCATCHRPTLRTGRSPFSTLSNRTFEAFTDLALHDMGPALDDGFDSGGVRGAEFRTPPLWGLRQSGPPYLHDGRADTLERAIELHGGEAEGSRAAYERLPMVDRRALLAFLRSL